MRARRLLLVGALAALPALAFAGTAQACSCARTGARESFRRSDAAIVGRLVKVISRGATEADYRYELERVYRGARMLERGQTISVRSARSEAACALPRGVGRRYGLFLVYAEGRWRAGLCSVISPRRLTKAVRREQAARRAGGDSVQVACA